ncbi:MAG: topoisomerase DNA-binding C4 zinc finger domain-containing protein [Candidatus Kerfeldbacteria bacterium]|nr:topoisomerase DNA-binding C4 zinc finger domain-containing protein [Candidatus Kerfeldbacteria bacterium]
MPADPELVKAGNQAAKIIGGYAIVAYIAAGVIVIILLLIRQSIEGLVQKVISKMKNKNKKNILGKCPVDGGGLVERDGKFGPFIGCSNYPKCHYTKPLG